MSKSGAIQFLIQGHFAKRVKEQDLRQQPFNEMRHPHLRAIVLIRHPLTIMSATVSASVHCFCLPVLLYVPCQMSIKVFIFH